MTVREVVRETADTVTLTLDTSASPFAFAPGQFNMVYLFGQGEVPISISGHADRPDELVHTIRGVGPVTRPMLDLVPGDVLGIRGPFGTAWPVEEARGTDVIVVAGGIGLAPLRPMIYHLLANRRDYARIVLIYGARQPDQMLFVDELHHWRGRFDLTVEVTVDQGTEDWFGPVGVVTRSLARARFDADDATVVTCGPEVMMRFVVHEAVRMGVPQDRIWASMERNMKCAIGLCGHCQWGPDFVCKQGPVYRWDHIAHRFAEKEL
ncbi:MAG: Ni/Fe hydrogenase subunit gamma [Deltaproteobacteria bacterium]|nr:MAG: Ni/Fe hydrogenase subunit gamma [Deltaproteobacteria bacterium]